jgi:outer membrane protein OmpA-like peptidoglycan-associated protein
MVLADWHGRGRRRGLQAGGAPGRGAWRGLLVLGCLAPIGLAGCGGPNDNLAPVDWWHHLEGGELAAERPPPPGANLPYPKVFTVPAKPTPPSDAFRETVKGELVTDRDATERLAAHTPIDLNAVPPPPPKQAAAPASSTADTANATLPAADAPPPPAAQAAPAAPTLTIAGTPPDEADLPQIPAAPPGPPAFEDVPAAPPVPMPAVVQAAPAAPDEEVTTAPPAAADTTLQPSQKDDVDHRGKGDTAKSHGEVAGKKPAAPAPPGPEVVTVLFATGDATLQPSQKDALQDSVEHRGKGTIAIEGHGEAVSDTPGAQQQAVELGLKRASAIAAALGKKHVPADKMVLSATAFGRDAVVRDQ